MRYTKGFEKLGLPDDFRFGIELEAFNVKTKGEDSLYSGESAKFITSKNLNIIEFEGLDVIDYGGIIWTY